MSFNPCVTYRQKYYLRLIDKICKTTVIDKKLLLDANANPSNNDYENLHKLIEDGLSYQTLLNIMPAFDDVDIYAKLREMHQAYHQFNRLPFEMQKQFDRRDFHCILHQDKNFDTTQLIRFLKKYGLQKCTVLCATICGAVQLRYVLGVFAEICNAEPIYNYINKIPEFGGQIEIHQKIITQLSLHVNYQKNCKLLMPICEIIQNDFTPTVNDMIFGNDYITKMILKY